MPADQPLRILILEDVPMDAELIEYELEKARVPFHARRVDTRDAFDTELSVFEPDLILSDFTLPRFDGMAALDIARERSPTVPFIIVTGSINEETAVRCMQAGAADYLLKGNLARIGPAIEAALERERSRDERSRAEAALRRSEASLRAIFDNSLQAFVLADRAGQIQALNVTAEAWGRRMIERPMCEGASIHDFVADAHDCFAGALRGERVACERTAATASGAESWYEACFTPVVDDGGGVIGVCLSLMDITRRRQLDEHMRRAERLQAAGRLAGGVAHEVNNMMTAVLGFSDFLLRSFPAADARREEVLEIMSAANRAANVTRQLLAFTRQQFLQPRRVDLNTVVQSSEALLRRSLGEGKSLVTRLDPDLGEVQADPSQIEQVLANLVLNARDATAEGGRVTIETAPVTLGPDYGLRHPGVSIPPGDYVMLAVSDTGTGMDAPTRERIFEPFFTTKPVGQGTGLGLSTVFGIVKQSCGFIWAYSEPGEGTVFKVYLPRAAAAEPRTAEPAAGPAVARRGSETILVVEDEEVVRTLTCRALRSQGYTVVEAQHGHEALERVAELDALHLVISDVVMPGMGGRELGARLALLRPDLPVLYMSGYTGEDVVQRGLLDPDAPFQQKPFSPSDLANKVRDMLDVRDAVS